VEITWKYYPDEVPEMEQRIIMRSYKEEPPEPFEPDEVELIYRPGVYHGVNFIYEDNSPSYFQTGYWVPRGTVEGPENLYVHS
jgi:hypothetical protein